VAPSLPPRRAGAAAATNAAQLPPLGPRRGWTFGETVAYVRIICTIQVVVKPLLHASTVTRRVHVSGFYMHLPFGRFQRPLGSNATVITM
jgi:hypothetical protein